MKRNPRMKPYPRPLPRSVALRRSRAVRKAMARNPGEELVCARYVYHPEHPGKPPRRIDVSAGYASWKVGAEVELLGGKSGFEKNTYRITRIDEQGVWGTLVKGGRDVRSGRNPFSRTRIASPKEFDPRSFRVISPGSGRHKMVVACPKGKYRGGRCRSGLEVQSVLRRIGTNASKSKVAQGLRFRVARVVHVSYSSLLALASTLKDFADIDPRLDTLGGTSLGKDKGYSIATDGEYAVIVNAEGYDYPRYRGPVILASLLPALGEYEVDRLLVRKSMWKDVDIDNPEQLQRVISSPYQYTQNPGARRNGPKGYHLRQAKKWNRRADEHEAAVHGTSYSSGFYRGRADAHKTSSRYRASKGSRNPLLMVVPNPRREGGGVVQHLAGPFRSSKEAGQERDHQLRMGVTHALVMSVPGTGLYYVVTRKVAAGKNPGTFVPAVELARLLVDKVGPRPGQSEYEGWGNADYATIRWILSRAIGMSPRVEPATSLVEVFQARVKKGTNLSMLRAWRNFSAAEIGRIMAAARRVLHDAGRNPDKSWHKAKRQDYYARYADDVKAGHKEGAEFWRGAFVAEAHAMAAEHMSRGIAANPPVISALRKVAAGAPARVKPLAARAILKVYDALAGKSKAAFARLPFRRMGSAAAALACGKRVTL